jgi:hypothetical protein
MYRYISILCRQLTIISMFPCGTKISFELEEFSNSDISWCGHDDNVIFQHWCQIGIIETEILLSLSQTSEKANSLHKGHSHFKFMQRVSCSLHHILFLISLSHNKFSLWFVHFLFTRAPLLVQSFGNNWVLLNNNFAFFWFIFSLSVRCLATKTVKIVWERLVF